MNAGGKMTKTTPDTATLATASLATATPATRRPSTKTGAERDSQAIDSDSLPHTKPAKAPGGSGDEPSQASEPPAPLPEARIWLVDGYNTLHAGVLRGLPTGDRSTASPGIRWWSSSARERLVTFARSFPNPDAEIWLVFDGPHPAPEPKRGERPAVLLEFAPSADDWIVRRVRNSEDPSAIAVVTGDHQVGGRTRHAGACVVSPRLFLTHCGLALAQSESEPP